MGKCRKILSVLLVCCMALSLLPISVFAAEDDASDEVILSNDDASSKEIAISEEEEFLEDDTSGVNNDVSDEVDPLLDDPSDTEGDASGEAGLLDGDTSDVAEDVSVGTSPSEDKFDAEDSTPSEADLSDDSFSSIDEDATDDTDPSEDTSDTEDDTSAGVVRYSVLILDTSGSMAGTPCTVQKQAAIKFCEAVLAADGENYVALVKLNSSSSVGCQFTDDLDTLKKYINSVPASGGTNINEALTVSDSLLSNVTDVGENVIKNVILCSDGLPESGSTSSNGPYTSSDNYTYYRYANAVYNTATLLKEKYNLYTLGFFHSLSGSELSFAQRLMEDAQNAGYYEVTDPNELEFTFGEIAGNITDSVLEKRYIREHIQYAQSQEYENEIVSGLGELLSNVLDDAVHDNSVAAYDALDLTNNILSLDFGYGEDELDAYDLILAQLLYYERDRFQDEAAEGLIATIRQIIENDEIAEALGASTLKIIDGALKTMEAASYWSNEFVSAYSLIEGLLDSDSSGVSMGSIADALSDNALWIGLALDDIKSLCGSGQEVIEYIACGMAYAKTSSYFRDVLGQAAVRLYMMIDNWDFSSFEEVGFFESVTDAAALEVAILEFASDMENYRTEGAKAVAEFALETFAENGEAFTEDAMKTLSLVVVDELLKCVPGLSTISVIRDSLAVGQTLLDLFTNIDERKYAGDMLQMLYCLAVVMDEVVEAFEPLEDDFSSAVRFDEAVNVYKSVVILAAEYGIKYETECLKAENDSSFRSQKKASWYSTAISIAATAKLNVENIRCHSVGLEYDPTTGKFTFDQNLKVLAFACPVDVVVADDTGTQVALLSDAGSSISSGYETFCFTVDEGDEDSIKVAIVPKSYEVTLSGTGNGTMDVYIANYEDWNIQDSGAFYDIAVTDTTTGYFVPSEINANLEDLVIDGDTKTADTGTSIYAIVFDANGGTLSGNSTLITGTDGRLTSLPTNPTRVGYVFDGWYTASIGGTRIDVSTEFPGDMTVYAQWTVEETTYTITFNANGGTMTGTNALITGTDGKLTSLPADPTRTGYTFNGWYTASADGDKVDTTTKFTKNMTVYAQWTEMTVEITYTVTFNANGGTFSDGSTVVTISTGTDGALRSLPTSNPIRNGYTFGGWYTGIDEGTNVVIGSEFSSDTTVYAHWNYNGSSSSSDGSSGGSSTGSSSSSSYTISVDSVTGGRVTSSRSSAAKGATVTLTVEPDDGYILDALVVKDRNGNEVELTEVNDGRYRFKMPASKVTVTPTFVESTELGEHEAVNPFVDVSEDAYYYDAILWAVDEEVTTGKTATEFDPDGSCTRAQMTTFLWRYAGEPEPESDDNPFTDVSSDKYYYKAVLWAVEQGITNGTTETTFEPDKTVTRAQTVTFLWRYAGEPGASTSDSFSDVESGKYFTEAVKWAVENEITTGYGDGTFRPYQNCSRAQIVTFMWRNFVD